MGKVCPVCESRSCVEGQHRCRLCRNAYMRAWRKRVVPTERQRLRGIARCYANVYIRRGKLVRGLCEICGSGSVECHHDDYDKPLEVRWFCRVHHLEFHRLAR